MRGPIIAIIMLAALCAAASLGAKGQTVKLVVSGGGLRQPIAITGKDVAFANPWGDAFVSPWDAIAEPAAGAPRFEVSFYEQLGPGDVQMKFVVDYVPGLLGHGAIHLPGRGDARYRANAGTIMRDGQDGKWFPASGEWERVVGARVR